MATPDDARAAAHGARARTMNLPDAHASAAHDS
jgi:hypothetical protein